MIFCFSTSLGDGTAAAAAVTVSTVYGNIEGFEYETLNGFKSDVFLGIPFAKPPVGELRYEKPVPVEPWNTTLSAMAYKSQCATFTYSSSQSEDCLYLNIMRPSTPSTDPRGYPVAVWIHGGGFITGSASLTAPYEYTVQNLVSRGMIFISTNYRLGPFGFYSNGDKNAPGNNGLWDLYEALKFVNKVIGNFGGNSKRVTIFGQSAGAACVSYLSLKPEAKKLFSQSIQMSGGFQGLWAQGDDVIASTKKLNTFLGCETAENPKNCAKNFTLAETQTALQSFINPIPGFGS
uniref:Carboxylic ester hydrolase n=1 Tax=Panagrolaimus sp. JU765 TaxID=591449 RepID=A0AC34QZW9_9BILA